jgi:hypothetical protein
MLDSEEGSIVARKQLDAVADLVVAVLSMAWNCEFCRAEKVMSSEHLTTLGSKSINRRKGVT